MSIYLNTATRAWIYFEAHTGIQTQMHPLSFQLSEDFASWTLLLKNIVRPAGKTNWWQLIVHFDSTYIIKSAAQLTNKLQQALIKSGGCSSPRCHQGVHGTNTSFHFMHSIFSSPTVIARQTPCPAFPVFHAPLGGGRLVTVSQQPSRLILRNVKGGELWFLDKLSGDFNILCFKVLLMFDWFWEIQLCNTLKSL